MYKYNFFLINLKLSKQYYSISNGYCRKTFLYIKNSHYYLFLFEKYMDDSNENNKCITKILGFRFDVWNYLQHLMIILLSRQ